MFKNIFSLLILFVAMGVNAQEAKFVVEDFSIQPGETVEVAIGMDNTVPVIGFQLDIVLPEQLSFVMYEDDEEYGLLDESRMDKKHTLTSGDEPVNNSLTFAAYHSKNKAFSGNSGTIMTIQVKAAESVQPGDYKIKFKNIQLVKEGQIAIDQEDFEATATVPAPNVDATSVTLDNTALTLTVGETGTLVATIAPDNATDKTLTWSTSNAEVATVADGVVTAVAAGTAVITVTTANGLTATCEVTVKEPVIEATGITLNKTELTLYTVEGTKEETLVATVAPENATDKTVTWTTSDANVAAVTSGGVVMAIGVGTATITATTHNGLTATCAVTVEEDAAVECITVDGLKNNSVYNVAGQYVGNNTKALNKGVYIVNGKKVVIR